MSGDSKRSVNKQSETALNSAGLTRIPWRCVVHAFSYLDKQSLATAQASSVAWNALETSMLWKAFYISEFEEQSATDSCVATDGVNTRWSKRFANRMQVELNMRNLRWTKHDAVTLPQRHGIIGATNSHLVCLQQALTCHVVVYSLLACKELWRAETVTAFVVDGERPRLVLFDKAVHSRDLATGNELRAWQRDDPGFISLFSAGRRLFALVERDSVSRTEKLLLFNLDNNDAPTELAPPRSMLDCCIQQDDARMLLVSDSEGECWDTTDWRKPQKLWTLKPWLEPQYVINTWRFSSPGCVSINRTGAIFRTHDETPHFIDLKAVLGSNPFHILTPVFQRDAMFLWDARYESKMTAICLRTGRVVKRGGCSSSITGSGGDFSAEAVQFQASASGTTLVSATWRYLVLQVVGDGKQIVLLDFGTPAREPI